MTSSHPRRSILPPDSPVRAVLVGIVLSLAAFAATTITTAPLAGIDPTILESPADADRWLRTLLLALNFSGFFIAAGFYLYYTGRGLAFLDIGWPTGFGWVLAVVAVFVGLVLNFGSTLVADAFSIEPTENQIMLFVDGDPTMVLVLIAIVFLFNAPGEELLYRGVIQKRCYDAFSKMGAVVVTSAIFALVHLPAYAFTLEGSLADPGSILLTLAIVFLASVVFGYAYARTDTLVVPIVAHALYNAALFALLYAQLRGWVDSGTDAPAVVAPLLAPLIG